MGQDSIVSTVTHYRLDSPDSNPGGQHPPPSSAEIKKKSSYTSTPPLGLHGLLHGELYPFIFFIFINYYYCHLLIYFICGRKQLGHEALHSLQSSSESTNEFNCTSNPTYAFMVCTGITLCLPLPVTLTFYNSRHRITHLKCSNECCGLHSCLYSN
jgi:hypothetical protein